jgi:hypothetical protein
MDFSTLAKHSEVLYEKLQLIHLEYFDFRKNNILFTWRWWIALSLIILPWIIWLFLRKKESTDRLLYAGLFVMVISATIDNIGIALGLCYYPIYVFPLMPEYVPYDICALPVSTMLTIQYFPKINPYIKALIYSLTSSFIFEPLNVWLGLYKQTQWKYYYSLPIMIFIYLIANYLASKNKFDYLK